MNCRKSNDEYSLNIDFTEYLNNFEMSGNCIRSSYTTETNKTVQLLQIESLNVNMICMHSITNPAMRHCRIAALPMPLFSRRRFFKLSTFQDRGSYWFLNIFRITHVGGFCFVFHRKKDEMAMSAKDVMEIAMGFQKTQVGVYKSWINYTQCVTAAIIVHRAFDANRSIIWLRC